MGCIRPRLGYLLGLWLAAASAAYCQELPAEAPAEAEQVGPAWLEFLKGLGQTETGLEKLAVIVLIVLMAIAAYWAVMLVIRRAILRLQAQSMTAPPRVRQGSRRAVTVLGLLANIVKWVIGIGALLWALSVFNVNVTPVLAGAGIVGIAVGFGAQTLVRDTISGFFLLLEGQYVVGDYVDIGGKFGLVQAIGLRVTVLKDLDNRLHYIPNGTIATVTVYEQRFVSYVVEVPLAGPEDAHRGADVIRSVVADMVEDFPRHLPMAGTPQAHISGGGTSCVRVSLAVFPTQDWLATDEFPARVRSALAGAEIPIPDGRTIRTYPDLSHMPLSPPTEQQDDA